MAVSERAPNLEEAEEAEAEAEAGAGESAKNCWSGAKGVYPEARAEVVLVSGGGRAAEEVVAEVVAEVVVVVVEEVVET